MAMLNNRNSNFSNFGNNQNMIGEFNKFKREIEQSGKDPRAILDEMVSSGKVTKQQVERARQMAVFYQSILGGR